MIWPARLKLDGLELTFFFCLYLFIFVSAGSSLSAGFSSCGERGLLSSISSARAAFIAAWLLGAQQVSAFNSSSSQPLEHRLNRCGAQTSGLFTTELPEKPRFEIT